MQEIIFCPDCGEQIPENAKYCPYCGYAIIDDDGCADAEDTAKPYDGYAIASLVLGIVSFFIFGIPAGILAIVFGTVSKHHGYTSRMATVGRILGIVALAVYAVTLTIMLIILL